MIAITLLLIIFALACLACFIALILVGYHSRLAHVTAKANENAALWAQAEAEREAISHDAARLQGERDQLEKIAGDALRLARNKYFDSSPASNITQVAHEYLRDNPCQWEFKDPDDPPQL